MSQAESDTSGGPPSIRALILPFGVFLFLLSFFLPAVGDLKGWECALWAIASSAPSHDDKISSLAAFGGWLNLEVLVFLPLCLSHRVPRIRSALTVLMLFSIPMTWIAIHRMYRAGLAMEPLQIGHFLWVIGILLIVAPDLTPALKFTFAKWLTVGAGSVIAVLSIPILIGFSMRAPTETDDLHYDQAWTTKDPLECQEISPNAVGRSDQWNSTDYTYMQSDCYRNVAAMLHEPQLCDNVKSGSLDLLIGSVVAKFECRNQRWTTGTAFPGTRSSSFPFQE